MRTHRDFEAWKKSVDFVASIYDFTKSFPKEETYGLSSQIRRSAVSIPSNIAEGAARKNDKEFIQFLYVALGSAAELETQLIISNKIQISDQGEINVLLESLEEISKMIFGLIKFLKNK
ncbi:MAG: four helix bundle protein [Cyclobacteriaceae bacterium]|nr:four helix bundle protein [Cyclobacteriaceae bacterium]